MVNGNGCCLEVSRSISRLCEGLLDGAATAEGTSTDKDDHCKHEGKDDPANPSESGKSLGRVAVREGVVLGSAVRNASSAVGQSSSAGEPEDPGKAERDSVTGNRGDHTTNASEEKTSLLRVKGIEAKSKSMVSNLVCKLTVQCSSLIRKILT